MFFSRAKSLPSLTTWDERLTLFLLAHWFAGSFKTVAQYVVRLYLVDSLVEDCLEASSL